MPVYDYTDNGVSDALVDTESQGFLDRLAFLMQHSPAKRYEVDEYTGSTWGSASEASRHVTRGIIYFHGEQDRYSAHDAYLMFKSPGVTLAGIFSDFGLPAPSPMPEFADHNPPSVDPVGEPWLAKGSNIWKVSPQFEPARWPAGSKFEKRVDGRDMTFYRTTVRERGGGAGPIASGMTYVPAWTDKANP